MNFYRLPALAFFACLLSSQCATFITGDIEEVDLYRLEPSNLPLKFSFDHFKPAAAFGDKRQLSSNLRKSFQSSRLFLEVREDLHGRPTTADPLYFRVRLENDKSPFAYIVGGCSGFLSGLTFLLLPAYERTPYHWEVEVFRHGTKAGQFQYDAASHYFAQWLASPFMFFSPPDFERSRITEEFVQTFLRDARAKNLI